MEKMSNSEKFLASLYGRPNTIKTQTSLFNNWVLRYLPASAPYKYWGAPDARITAALEGWENYKLSASTTKMCLSLALRYIHFCGGPKMDGRRYARYITRRQQQTEVQALTREQAHAVLEECKRDSKLYEVCLLAYHTGMRKGEIFGLEWKDIDIIKSRITVRRSYDGPTKSGFSRIIPMSGEIEAFFLDKTTEISHNYIEGKVIAKQFDPNPLFRAACRRAGVPEITFHGLRHTFATLALEAGRSPKMVQTVLGHSKLSTTLDLYWSTTQEELELGFC
jgi:integrase